MRNENYFENYSNSYYYYLLGDFENFRGSSCLPSVVS